MCGPYRHQPTPLCQDTRTRYIDTSRLQTHHIKEACVFGLYSESERGPCPSQYSQSLGVHNDLFISETNYSKLSRSFAKFRHGYEIILPFKKLNPPG